MRKSQIPKDFAIQKLMTAEDATVYFRLRSMKTMFEAALKAKAIRRIGRCVRIDKNVLKTWLEENPIIKNKVVKHYIPYDWGEEYDALCEKFDCK